MSSMPPVGSFMFVGINGCELTSETQRFLDAIEPAGIVLFLRNIASSRQLRVLTGSLHAQGRLPPLVAIDQESGTVNRLRHVVGELPTLRELASRGVPAVQFGRVMGRLLRAHGVDLDFAPVLDLGLFDDKTDNALQERCWAANPEMVALQAGAFLAGLQDAGVTGCPKHFPGLGGARLDAHEELPTITRSRDQLWAEDIFPYRVLLQDMSAVMVGHGHYTALDGDKPLPASLSPNVIGGLLRARLGFDGLVLTDDMEMGAIERHGRLADAVVEAIGAGADAVLTCHTAEKAWAAHEALVRALEDGIIPSHRLTQTRQRLERITACNGPC